MLDRVLLRLSTALLALGIVVSSVAGVLHTEGGPANDHATVFAAYARSSIWTPVHLGQFVGMALLVAGLLALVQCLKSEAGLGRWVGRFALVSAVGALALYGALQAVDGVALKQAVNAWLVASESEKPVLFAASEAIRWVEWGLRSYHSFVFGLALLLTGTVVVRSDLVPDPIGYLVGIAGLGYFAQGWIVGSEGFSSANTMPTLITIVALVASVLWLTVFSWRLPGRTASVKP